MQVDLTGGELYFTDPSLQRHLFSAAQLHFHAPSEHTVNGKHYDLEMHIVHIDKVTRQPSAVIGLFFDVQEGGNRPNDLIADLNLKLSGKSVPALADPQRRQAVYEAGALSLEGFLSGVDFSELYHYDGSLTTPPCTEGITWLLVE